MPAPIPLLNRFVRFVARRRISLHTKLLLGFLLIVLLVLGTSALGVVLMQRDLVRDMVDVEQVGPLNVKGFQKPVTAYSVIGLKGVRTAETAGGEGMR